jgi:hypothetical protein
MLTKYINNQGPYSRNEDFLYVFEVRSEAFSQEPLYTFIRHVLPRHDEIFVINSTDFLLVSEYYDWVRIKQCFVHLVSVFDEPSHEMNDLLAQVWKHIPEYLDLYKNFYSEVYKSWNPYLMLLHLIITGQTFMMNNEQIKASTSITCDSTFLSLDTGIVTKLTGEHEMYKFGRMISSSKARLRYGISVVQEYLWPEVSSDIINNIRFNTKRRYYNISTKNRVNASTAVRMPHVNEKYRVVSEEKHGKFFNHIIELLDNPDLRYILPETKLEYKLSQYAKQSPPQIIPKKLSTPRISQAEMTLSSLPRRSNRLREKKKLVYCDSSESTDFLSSESTALSSSESTALSSSESTALSSNDESKSYSDESRGRSSENKSHSNDSTEYSPTRITKNIEDIPIGEDKVLFTKSRKILSKSSSMKKKKNNIPSKIRQMTWRKYIGNTMDGMCWSCGCDICNENWHCGHVLASSKGGPNTVENLRPLCQGCNLSMGNKHMAKYILEHNMKGKGSVEFRANEERTIIK